MKDNCIFCKIIKGEISSHKIYEDDSFLCFLDINPISKGHVVLIPKEHYENLSDMSDELLSKVLIVAKKIANKLVSILKCDGYNIYQNNGLAAGQSVLHYHIHIIPRYKNDNIMSKCKVLNLEKGLINLIVNGFKK